MGGPKESLDRMIVLVSPTETEFGVDGLNLASIFGPSFRVVGTSREKIPIAETAFKIENTGIMITRVVTAIDCLTRCPQWAIAPG